ncbi:MAG: bifunctional UDP-3-O-[3-hydroxymyristoyl] N-acetylglucosamine deacetylase/3-hydroxyacyl-ACP dehydratase, partial [Bacteroidales bacterium]|nr:bifunctional UDP-3-O-[3-hydroxymyristoyl] N-acetylglucosamine deacetylase/3-hydroxyacyl-ACP dehydratase [Bacteroidales bacterium]
TTISHKGVTLMTIEHTLAALAGLEIDNVLIEIDAEETPILDGSAAQIVDCLQRAGIREQEEDRAYYEINNVQRYYNAERKTEIIALPYNGFKVSVMIDYATEVLNTQNAELRTMEDFPTQIAPCRTFVFLHELEYLLNNNLIKGGDLSNAIVFVNKMVEQDELDRLAFLFNKPSVEVKKEGILNNLDLHFANEPARHKLLDVIGDTSLIGKPIKGHIIATRPGHSANTEFARILRKQMKIDKQNALIPHIDTSRPPQYDINDIKRMLPHRPPFLLVDKIYEVSETHVIGMKNVTMNESFFVGHFPDEPVMPGVLQIEAMAQAGGILILSTVPDPENYVTYFLKLEDVKFRKKVVPGDTMIFKLDLVEPIRRGICHMKGFVYVGDKVVTEGDLFAQIIKKQTN